MHPVTVRRFGFPHAVTSAHTDTPGKPRLRLHALRHTFASILLSQGVNIAFASRQLGHASVSTTLNVYTHLFDHAEHAATVMERLEGRFGAVLQPAAPERVAGRGPVANRRAAPPPGPRPKHDAKITTTGGTTRPTRIEGGEGG